MLGLAIVCACIGFALAFVLTLRHSAWDLDRTYFENNSDVLSLAGLFGGSIGWFIGAGIGWFLSPSAIRPSQDHAWRLRVAAVLPAAIAVLIFASSTAIESPEAQTALAVIPAGAALVSVTLWVLSQRGRFRRAGAVVGAIVAMAIVVSAGMRFSSFLPLERAYLTGWRMGPTDAENFAPNLLLVVPAAQSCPTHLPAVLRADGFGRGGAGAAGRLQWLEGHVPRWLPDGFGLVSWDNWRLSIGEWRDESCRQIRLVLFEGSPDSPRWDRYPVVDQIGDWAVIAAPCAGRRNSEASCLWYLAWSPEERGAGEGEILGLHLQMLGIDRVAGDRIALGIPVRGPPRFPQQAG